MPDSMQTDAMERLRQMYSKATPNSRSAVQTTPEHHTKKSDEKERSEQKTQPQLHNNNTDNLLDIFMRDKEKSLIVLLIVLLVSEKADSTLVLALLYLIL